MRHPRPPRSLAAVSLLFLGALFLVVQPAAPQSPDAPQPDKVNKILYPDGSGGGASLWMNTKQNDGGDETVTMVLGGAGTDFSKAFPLNPALADTLTMDTSQPVTFNIRFGSGLLATAGTLSVELKAGATMVAAATGTLETWVGAYRTTTLTATPLVDTITPAMGNLVWTIKYTGQGTAFIQTGQSGQFTQVILPLTNEPPSAAPTTPLIEENITAPELSVDLISSEPVNATYLYHWVNSTLAGGEGAFNGTATAGSAVVVLTGPSGTELLNATLTPEGPANTTFFVSGEMAGNWTLRVEASGFQGDLHVSVSEVREPDGSTPTPSDGSASESPADGDANATTGSNETATAAQEEKGVPGPSAGLVVLALIAVAVVGTRSRRRA